jgi:hypothetical protein
MASYQSNVAQVFKPGSKITIEPGGHTANVNENGDVKVTGLDEYKAYTVSGTNAAGESRSLTVFAKSDATRAMTSLERSERERARLREQSSLKRPADPLPSAAPGRTVTPNITTGARSSVDVKARHQDALTDQLSEDRKVGESDPRPAPNQVDVQGVPQRSDTPFGQATPKDPKELVPAPGQNDVSGPQRSDTEEGTAAPKDRSEVVPSQRQEDAPKGLKQSSDTPHGEITPKESQSRATGKAGVKEAVKAEKARESSSRKVGQGKPAAQKKGVAKKPTAKRKAK